ncbi:MAG TPA: response regulator transcription factor [Bacillota bacterium]|nr:response regulator transcription factor [Bacillota bacterium]HPZ22824.1 response regulator transcription factor [Bacillota bacterium]HQD20474.1 response regulator transcription factor [Bacillota bacterium]
MRVLIVDDDALIRDSLKMLLELEGDFEVLGLAGNGQEALDFCRRDLPDLVLMDIRMPVMDGVMGTKRIKALYPQVQVVILTTFRDDEYIKEALKNGAAGYILKSQPADSIIDSLRAVAKGNIVLERDVATSLSSMLREDKKKGREGLNLTERELEIMSAVGRGLSNREIAQDLFLSEGTVRNYVTSLLEKLNLRDRTQLALFYVRNFE